MDQHYSRAYVCKAEAMRRLSVLLTEPETEEERAEFMRGAHNALAQAIHMNPADSTAYFFRGAPPGNLKSTHRPQCVV